MIYVDFDLLGQIQQENVSRWHVQSWIWMEMRWYVYKTFYADKK